MPQPKLLSKPWASDGLKNNIPAERNGGLAQEAATYTEGFPSITMTPISVGGKPPSGKDMNGVLYEISAHTVWQNQGGRYRFDQTFCDAIGGYPKGSVLISDTLDTEYISLVDANTHNPHSGNNTGKWAIHAGKGLKASTTQAGSTQLSSATNSDREDMAATSKAVKIAYDKAEESAGKGLPVGAVIGFPRAVTNPEGYLKADGSTFAQATYPDLHRVLGGNKLPNLTRSDVGMTAYFPIESIPDGWIKYDEIATRVTQAAYPELYRKLVAQYGSIDAVPKAEDRFIRNASGSLAVGTQQGDAIRNIKGSLEALYGSQRYTLYTKAEGAFATDSDDGANTTFRSSTDDHAHRQKRVVFDASRSVPVADEVRPKALVMVLCIKAQNSLDDVVMWIKAFGKVTNAGTLDAATLAADIQRKANRDEVAPKAHTHRAADITDFAQAVGNLFAAQKAATGYQKMANELILEWGSLQVPDDGFLPVVFPVAFPNACLNVQATVIFESAVTYSYVLAAHAGKITKTGCHVGISENGIAGSKTVHWVAIGY